MRLRVLTSVVLSAALLTGAHSAESMVVHLTDGSADTIAVSAVAKCLFSSAPMAVARPGGPSARILQAGLRFSAAGLLVHLPAESRLKVEILGVNGRVVASLSDAQAARGVHVVPLTGARVGSGLYLARVWIDGALLSTSTVITH